MSIRRAITWLAWTLSCASAIAQTVSAPDKVLAMPDDTVKVLKLSDLCFAYRRIDGDSALLFGRKASLLARALHYPRGEAQACNDMAIIAIDRSAFEEADSLLTTALAIRTALHDSAGIGAIHNKLGNVRQAQFRLEEALEENYRALRIFERTGPPAREAIILNNIAILQSNMRRYKDALATHYSALAIRARIGDEQGVAESQGNMANVQLQLGDTTAARASYEKAAAYFRRNDLQRELAIQLHNLAGLLAAQGDRERAIPMYAEALAIRERIGEQKAIASTLTSFGDLYLRTGRRSAAGGLLWRALRLSRTTGARNEEMQALLELARFHALENHGDSAYWYYEHYSALRDSTFNADMGGRLAEMETRYGTERKEREIQRQRADIAAKNLALAEMGRRSERRRFWLAVVGGVAGVILLVSLLVLQIQRRRSRALRDAAVIAERERGLKNMIDSTEGERRRIAAELHDGVGQQISGLRFRLESAAAQDTTLNELLVIADEAGKEVRDLAHQMMPRALATQGLVPALTDMLNKALSRPGLKHGFEVYGVEGRLPQAIETGVYRIAQELVNNIIKHARANSVQVQLLRNKGFLVLIVEDDGVGLGPAVPASGLGMQSMGDRARLLRGALTIEPAPDHGTVATLRVPLEAETTS